MKNAIILTILLILVAISAMAQTYNVTTNRTAASLSVPTTCTNCTFNISNGVTLTFTQNQTLRNATITGGNVNVNTGRTLTFNTTASRLTNTMVNFASGSNLVSSAPVTLNNSTFTFLGTAVATVTGTVNMVASSMKFLGSSHMQVDGAFNMTGASSLIVGDGTPASTAFVNFNTWLLSTLDLSYITMLGPNNSYINWRPYNLLTGAIWSILTQINCGVLGFNNCSAGTTYGPSTLTVGGVSSNATLPVKLSAFNVKLTGVTSNLTWTTDIEQKSSRFEIERSVDGINWNRIGSVKAQGNSTVKVNYAYNDILKGESVMSYRLKIIDEDASFAYSPIKTVKTQGGVAEMKIFPNPATEYVVITAKNNANKMNVQLINLNGQILKQSNGNGNIQMSVSGVNAGSYVVRVTDATGSAQSFKLMIN